MGPLGLLKVFSVSIRKLVFEKMEKSYIFYRNHQIYLYPDDRVETSEECTFLRLIANLKGYTILRARGIENELIFLLQKSGFLTVDVKAHNLLSTFMGDLFCEKRLPKENFLGWLFVPLIKKHARIYLFSSPMGN